MIEVLGDRVGDKSVHLVELFLLGRGVEWRSKGILLIRKVLLDHPEQICLLLFITAN
jgi:hypothetical protein